jgi:hypothetical protein
MITNPIKSIYIVALLITVFMNNHMRSRLYFPAHACDLLIKSAGRKDATKIAQTWHVIPN